MKYSVEKVTVDSPIDWSPHHHAFVNPYNGCTMGCPYCFWRSQEGWEGRIQVRENIAEKLDESLQKWPKNEFIYLGSVCDPFMEIEREYRLTWSCLEVIRRHAVPLLITTSGVTDLVREYVPLLKAMQQRVIVVLELARIPELEKFNAGCKHMGIANANYLVSQGLEVWATMAPVLPGLTEMESILMHLDERIPVYVDSLRCEENSVQARGVQEWISRDYPELTAVYEQITRHNNTAYFTAFKERWRSCPRIKMFPYQLVE